MQIKATVRRLGEFLDQIEQIRASWQVRSQKEMFFRGEGRDYGETKLRPSLYRPIKGFALKSAIDLIEIEDDLFKRFQHDSTELAKEDTSDTWASYFLMQHSLAPTRLLDWSDGSLVALHFAVRTNHDEPNDRFVYVLDPYWLMDCIRSQNRDYNAAKQNWIEYCRKYPTKQLDEDDWDHSYLPAEDGHE